MALGLLLLATPVDGAWRLDFEGMPEGPLTEEALRALSPVPVLWSQGLATDEGGGRFFIVGRSDGGRALEVLYPIGGVGPRETGGQWAAALPPRDAYAMEHRIRFSDDFDWVLGGKLPGLAGGSAPTGGFFDPDGFTSRYMWREGGRLVVYLYWAGQGSSSRDAGRQYGVDIECGVTLERGREYVLRQRVRLNTPGEADGELEVWVDGVRVLHRADLLFRDRRGKTWQIDRFFFSTFHGGADASWAPSRDCAVRFDDFVVEP